MCLTAIVLDVSARLTRYGVSPDPKLDYTSTCDQHTQTHKYNKRCAMRAAVLPIAAAPLSAPEGPPSQLPTPLPAANLRSNKLHSCVDPAWSCAAAAAETQDAAHLLALHQRRKMRVKQMQQQRRKPVHAHHVRRRNHGNARHADRSCGAPHANAS